MDSTFQRSVIKHGLVRWHFYLAAIVLLVSLANAWSDPEVPVMAHLANTFWRFLPGAIAGLALLPLVIYDLKRATNRVAGPIFRLRREVQNLADGLPVQRLRLRDGDHWETLVNDFNRLSATIQQERAEMQRADSQQTIYPIGGKSF